METSASVQYLEGIINPDRTETNWKSLFFPFFIPVVDLQRNQYPNHDRKISPTAYSRYLLNLLSVRSLWRMLRKKRSMKLNRLFWLGCSDHIPIWIIEIQFNACFKNQWEALNNSNKAPFFLSITSYILSSSFRLYFKYFNRVTKTESSSIF